MKEIDIINLLKSYKTCKKFVQAQEYAKTYFDPTGTQEISKSEQCEARMNTIECLIQLLAPSEEYTLLYLHYIKGIPTEKCAESMFISTRTAYRLLSKAHKSIYELVSKKGADDEQREAD